MFWWSEREQGKGEGKKRTYGLLMIEAMVEQSPLGECPTGKGRHITWALLVMDYLCQISPLSWSIAFRPYHNRLRCWDNKVAGRREDRRQSERKRDARETEKPSSTREQIIFHVSYTRGGCY